MWFFEKNIVYITSFAQQSGSENNSKNPSKLHRLVYCCYLSYQATDQYQEYQTMSKVKLPRSQVSSQSTVLGILPASFWLSDMISCTLRQWHLIKVIQHNYCHSCPVSVVTLMIPSPPLYVPASLRRSDTTAFLVLITLNCRWWHTNCDKCQKAYDLIHMAQMVTAQIPVISLFLTHIL